MANDSDDKQRDIEQHTGRPAPGRSHVAGGPSPLTDVDEMALHAPKSEWQERTAPAAGDPVSDAEKNGLSILGASTVDDDAHNGVSDAPRDGHAAPIERQTDIQVAGEGGRRNPPLMADAGMGDGGISVSGGASGGARGNAGTSDSGAGGPLGDTAGGPSEHDAGSRFSYDHPDTDVGDEAR